jgi:hypothetical protein
MLDVSTRTYTSFLLFPDIRGLNCLHYFKTLL